MMLFSRCTDSSFSICVCPRNGFGWDNLWRHEGRKFCVGDLAWSNHCSFVLSVVNCPCTRLKVHRAEEVCRLVRVIRAERFFHRGNNPIIHFPAHRTTRFLVSHRWEPVVERSDMCTHRCVPLRSKSNWSNLTLFFKSQSLTNFPNSSIFPFVGNRSAA